jgi:hypothetical protein
VVDGYRRTAVAALALSRAGGVAGSSDYHKSVRARAELVDAFGRDVLVVTRRDREATARAFPLATQAQAGSALVVTDGDHMSYILSGDAKNRGVGGSKGTF